MHPSRIFTQGHRLFGMPRSAQNPDYSTHSDKLQFDLLPDSRRSVHHALILVIALVFLGTGTSLRAQNYNPNNFDSEYIMNAIKIPHSDLSIIAAHRGIHALVDGTNAYVPENSIKAIDLTAQAGIEVIELDVKLTSDTIPILSHDMTWGREWCYNMGGAFSNNTAFDPFTSQGSNSSNDGRDPTVASMSLSQTKNYREGTYGTYLRDSVSFYCSYYGQFTGAYPPTVQDALNEIKNKNIQMVVAFDIKDAATATAVWDIVANTSDSEGRSFAKSVLFKMPATAFQPNNTCSTAVQCFKNTFPTTNSLTYSAVNYFPYYSTSNISPSAFGSETEIINNIKTFQNEGTISIPAVEVDFKQNGGILDETLSYAKAYKGSSSTVGIFSPYAEYYYPSDTAQTPLFFTTRAYCCLSMAAYYYGPTMADLNAASSPNPATPFPTIPNPSYGAGQPTDTADDRGNYTFVTDNKFQLITTDRPQWYDKKLNDDKKRVLGPMQPNPSAASNTVSVALSASDASPAAGDNVELTVIISPSYATGTVTFTDNSTTLGTANVNNGSASFAVTSIVAGSHVYTAAYSGDATYLQNTSNSLTVTTQASATGGSTNYTGTTIAQQVAVPAYFYPPTYWSQLVAPVGFAVANVANGPNYGVDSNYVSAIAASHKAGTKVLGYVDTGYFGGTTPARTTRLNQTDVNSWTTQIEQDVDAWYSLYGSNGIDGIFFDDGQNVCGNNNQYVTLYTDILNYVKQNHPGAYVITNPGVSVPQCLQNIADTLLTYEGSYDCYINDSSCAAGQGYTPLI